MQQKINIFKLVQNEFERLVVFAAMHKINPLGNLNENTCRCTPSIVENFGDHKVVSTRIEVRKIKENQILGKGGV